MRIVYELGFQRGTVNISQVVAVDLPSFDLVNKHLAERKRSAISKC